MRSILIQLVALALLSSCGRQPVEQFQKVKDAAWDYTSPHTFDVNIAQPGYYRMFVQIRYTQAYNFSNIWVNLTEKKPDGKEEKTRFNIPLFDLEGKPFGSFAGHLYDRSYPDAEVDGKDLKLYFPEAGTYHLTLEQDMRPETLKGITELGVRLIQAK